MITKFRVSGILPYTYFKNIKYSNTNKLSWNPELNTFHFYNVPHICSYSSLNCSSNINITQDFSEQKFLKKHNFVQNRPSRSIWGWLNSVFNRVDESRILAVGPDRACSEWLLRCGAGVKWVNSENWIKDYNSLPVGSSKLHKIEEVDGTESSVMFIGFPHFRNCKYIRKVIFHKAAYIDDDAMSQLHFLTNSLKELQISSCGNVSRNGLNHIKMLVNMESLLLYDLPLIKDKDEVVRDLQAALPNCNISFPYAQASEIKK